MDAQQAAGVLRKVAAYQPNQRIDDESHRAWAEALADYDFRDALDAVATLAVAPRQPGQPFWMEPRDVVAEIRRIQAKRFDERRHLMPDPPPETNDDVAAYLAWKRQTVAAMTARHWSPPPALSPGESRPVAALVEAIADDVRINRRPSRQ